MERITDLKDVMDLLQHMQAACPVGCTVSIRMSSTDPDNMLVLQWDWKSHHFRREFNQHDRLRGIYWDQELEIASHRIREYIKKTSERQVTNGKEESRSERR